MIVRMNRIDQIFTQLRQGKGKHRGALMPYVTAGDPDVRTTGRLLEAAQAAGASVCEVGIPFSDSIADGPVIQSSMTYALGRGLKVAHVLQMVADARSKLRMGLVAMVSYTIVHRIGAQRFVGDAAAAGFDGFIFPDLPVDESEAVMQTVAQAGLACSVLIAPTTPIDRARRIAATSSGFVYLLSRAGITGERSALPPDLSQRIQRLREVTDLPIAVGFGISSAQQVHDVVQVADAAIVGSALMRRVAEHREAGSQAVVDQVSRFVHELAGGLGDQAPGRGGGASAG